MNTYIPIKHLDVTPNIEQTFLIEGADQRFGSNRKPFSILKLRDLTGTIKCFLFEQELNEALEVGKFIVIVGKVELRNEEMQLVAKSWQPFNGHPENLSDYIHCPNPNVMAVYAERLQKYLDGIEDSDYRNITGNICSRMKLFDKLQSFPYKLDGQWSYRGGLLIHAVMLLGIITKILEAFEDGRHELNRDELILGTIFRELGWWPSTTQKGDLFVASSIYQSLGERFVAGMVANNACRTTEQDLKMELPLTKKLALQHIAFIGDEKWAGPELKLIMQAEKILKETKFAI